MATRLRDALAVTFASLFPLAMAFVYFVALADSEDKESLGFRVAFGIGKCVQFLFPIVYVFCFDREQIRITRPKLRGLALGLGFGVLVAAAMFALYFGWVRHIPAVADETPVMVHEKVMQFKLDYPFGFLLIALAVCGPHSLSEEYYWRWFVFGWMRRHMPPAAAIVLSAVGFMLHHIVILGVYFPGHFWTLAMPFSLCVAVGGGFWAWLYQRTESLWAPWISHAIIDAAIMVVGYVMLSRYWT